MKNKGGLVDRLTEAVDEEVERVLKSAAMQEWIGSTRLRPGDFVVFNNSFLYREGVTKSTKNNKYLCVKVSQDGEPTLPVFVMETRINNRFKHLSAKQVENHQLIDIHAAVEQELSRMGVIVRALVARIGADEPAEIAFDGKRQFETLRYEPDLDQVAEVRGATICLSRLDDIDLVWGAIEEEFLNAGIDGAEDLAEKFESVLGELRESAGRPVDVDDVDPNAPSILSEVLESFEDQVRRYEDALARHTEDPDDAEAANELLRVAYNFADGASNLIVLVIGLSDLKPLLFWLTIASQSDLADRFGDLPFALVGKAKPSLGEYRIVIAGARNRSFHDVFAFERSFRVRLTGDAFKAAELRLFRDYTKRTRPTLDFEDRELVDLLAGFTRASERAVPIGFWEKNLDVMRGVAGVARALRDGLLLVASE
jgi:hypothetical protein